MKRFFAQCYIWLLLVVLYAPIVFIAVFSFTESKVLGNWTGFSTKLYSNLFTGDMQGSGSLMSAIQNTLLIALVAASVSTLIGTIAAIGIHNMKGRGKQAILISCKRILRTAENAVCVTFAVLQFVQRR